jgi:hypothetical protein
MPHITVFDSVVESLYRFETLTYEYAETFTADEESRK